MAAETRKPQTYQKAPGAPTKAQQLARLTEQMLDLARETARRNKRDAERSDHQ
ncbi:MAG: hypothetical protein BWY85_01145 [Firmicutes bacterium ADurb.Bin506]|nr:MAG: hypothetical protein BWY85_01145 [Firmicutes bacterium ADurb.Bin506]